MYVIIPAYNEGVRIAQVIEKLLVYTKNVVVVDDGSSDTTFAVAQKSGAITLRHKVNLGKGAALKTGCDYALSKGATQIVVVDADGQHEPDDLPKFFEALKDNDIVFSYRLQSKTMPAVLKFGNWFINKILNILFGVDVKDSQCGYRAFSAGTYRKVRWRATDYYMETEMLIKTGREKLTYTQIPIETIYADSYKGTTVIDGVKIVLKMVGERFLG